MIQKSFSKSSSSLNPLPCHARALSATLHTNTSTTILRYHVPMNYLEHIGIDRSGKPCIRGTRIAVADIFDYLGGGMSIAEVLDDFPDLTTEDIQACFAFRAAC
jgi:uncharacterized protein (DUF433 family)